MISARALAARARLLRAVRSFFARRRFVEVDPPVRIRAPAPEPWIDPVPVAGGYLRTSPELQMKRLLAEGHGRIYSLGPVFRKGETGKLHSEEFTLLEWYRADAGYEVLMKDCESLLRSVARRCAIRVRGHTVRLDRGTERIGVCEALARVGVDARTATDEGYCEAMGLHVEPRLGLTRPTFLVDYPVSQGALAKRKEEDPGLVERFELFVAGIELANGWTELTDPVEQRERFERDAARRLASGKEHAPLDERFLSSLGACPPCAGVALGVDRLLLVLLDETTIDAVLPFPADDL